jgi:hypothetical protein
LRLEIMYFKLVRGLATVEGPVVRI